MLIIVAFAAEVETAQYPFQSVLKRIATMAFEVARVHQLICSRVGGEADFQAFKNEHASLEADGDSSLTCSPVGAPLNLHYPGGLSCNFPSFGRGGETNSSPLELSSVSTETESDEDDDLLQSLAQQIAHSMLNVESSAETLTGVCGESGYPETRNLSNVEVNEVSICSPLLFC